MKISKRRLMKFISFWPPYAGAGIKVRHVSEDMRRVRVEMKLHFWNANYVGTHFGGSLFSMTDPFYMVMLIENLGPEYIVWDKSASIRYRRPGKGTVSAEFELTETELAGIRETLTRQEKYEHVFRVDVKDEGGEVVAEVEKLVYIRRRSEETLRKASGV